MSVVNRSSKQKSARAGLVLPSILSIFLLNLRSYASIIRLELTGYSIEMLIVYRNPWVLFGLIIVNCTILLVIRIIYHLCRLCLR